MTTTSDLADKKTEREQLFEGERKRLKECMTFILEECRMVLPGVQALFGFQLIAVFNENFNTLTSIDKSVHLTAIFFTVASIGLLMGPAAYHRLTSPDGVPPEMCTIGTRLVCVGMATLMISTALDIYIITNVIVESALAGIIFGGIALLFLTTVWYVFPLISKNRHHHHNGKDTSTPVLL